MTDLTRWEMLELFLFDHNKAGTRLTSREYATDADISPSEASDRIQAYLSAQRGPKSKTLYVLHRAPNTRTSSAEWLVGIRTKDARDIGTAFQSDVLRKVKRAFEPDLRRLAVLNPRAARLAESQISGVVEGALKVLEAAAKGIAVEAET